MPLTPQDGRGKNIKTMKAKKVSEEITTVTETLSCVDCQGDGKWDGVICDSCKGSGKIFKDGTVVSTSDGSFTFKGGKAIKN